MKIQLIALALVTWASTSFASGWSLRERSILKSVPESFRSHTGGIVETPSDADVAEAIAFGQATKEKPDPLLYGWIWKADTSFLSTDAIYVAVSTPLRLIAEHAQEQAREYRKLDDAYVTRVRQLGAVRLSLNQQFLSARYRMIANTYDVILLRDGLRVDPLRQLTGWSGPNPFADKPNLISTANVTLAQVQRAAMQQLRATMTNVDPATKRMMVGQLSSTGWSDAQICEGLGWTPEQLAEIRGEGPGTASAPISLTENDAVFAIAELRKPGKYELVFRQPTVGMFGELKDKEVRFAISFDRFR